MIKCNEGGSDVSKLSNIKKISLPGLFEVHVSWPLQAIYKKKTGKYGLNNENEAGGSILYQMKN